MGREGGREESVWCSEVITKLLVTLTVVRDLVLDYRVRGGFQKALESAPCRSALFPEYLQMLHPN